MAFTVHLLVEICKLEDRQVVVPELDARIKHEPALLCLDSKLHSLNDVIEESFLLVCKLLLLLRSKLTLILVILDSDEINMADLDLFFKKEFDLDFGKVNVSLALCDDQVWILLRIPLVLHTESGSIVGHLNKHLLKG